LAQHRWVASGNWNRVHLSRASPKRGQATRSGGVSCCIGADHTAGSGATRSPWGRGRDGPHGVFKDVTPLRSHITIEDVAGTAVYLASPLSGQTTGEVIYVDGGFNILGLPVAEE